MCKVIDIHTTTAATKHTRRKISVELVRKFFAREMTRRWRRQTSRSTWRERERERERKRKRKKKKRKERVSHNRSRGVLYVFPCRLSGNNESCHASVCGQKRRTNARQRVPIIFREGGNDARTVRANLSARILSLPLSLTSFILYTELEAPPPPLTPSCY